jgi:hypothetical protein
MSTNSLSVAPSAAIISPNDSINNLNLVDFSNVGRNISADSTAFKKIQNFSKLNPQFMYTQSGSYYSRLNKVNNLYVNELTLDNLNPSVSIHRQHNYTSPKATLNMFTTLVDTNSFKKFFKYTVSGTEASVTPKVAPTLVGEYTAENLFSPKFQNLTSLMSLYNQKYLNPLSFNFVSAFNQNTALYDHFLSSTNAFLVYLPSTKPLPTFVNQGGNAAAKDYDFSAGSALALTAGPSSLSTSGASLKTLNLKSGGQSITTQEKSLREINKSNPASFFQNNLQATNGALFGATNNLPNTESSVFSLATLG